MTARTAEALVSPPVRGIGPAGALTPGRIVAAAEGANAFMAAEGRAAAAVPNAGPAANAAPGARNEAHPTPGTRSAPSPLRVLGLAGATRNPGGPSEPTLDPSPFAPAPAPAPAPASPRGALRWPPRPAAAPFGRRLGEPLAADEPAGEPSRRPAGPRADEPVPPPSPDPGVTSVPAPPLEGPPSAPPAPPLDPAPFVASAESPCRPPPGLWELRAGELLDGYRLVGEPPAGRTFSRLEDSARGESGRPSSASVSRPDPPCPDSPSGQPLCEPPSECDAGNVAAARWRCPRLRSWAGRSSPSCCGDIWDEHAWWARLGARVACSSDSPAPAGEDAQTPLSTISSENDTAARRPAGQRMFIRILTCLTLLTPPPACCEARPGQLRHRQLQITEAYASPWEDKGHTTISCDRKFFPGLCKGCSSCQSVSSY